MGQELLDRIATALVESVDAASLDRALKHARASATSATSTSPSLSTPTPTSTSTSTSTPTSTAAGIPTSTATDLSSRLLLVDLLDDEILSARAGDRPYPLRVFLTLVGEHVAGSAFELACALNVFLRVEMDDEARMRLGVEASRLFYRFVHEQGLPVSSTTLLSPLLASLLSGQLDKLRFESVDHQRVFDGSLHERAAGSDGTSAAIREPLTFLCRVTQTGMVRARAEVRT